ncbi:MAG: MarP family serine protease [Actinomycetota bacterium]|nr:MarP family serine protease [Actinomycetota bacterium]
MNLLDVLILLLLVISLFTGFRRGAVLQLVTYSGLIIGLIAGAILAPEIAALATDPFAQATIALLVLLLFAAVGDAIGWLIGRRVWAAARRSRLDPIDAGAGSVVAGAAALLTVWFLAFNLVQGPFPPVSSQIRGSVVVRGLDAVLPRPPSLLAQVRTFFDRFGFPEVFAGLPPAPAGPVRGPTQAEARQAFDAADQSTVRIVGQACDRIQEGSGFVVDENHVVTNAHVVAGVSGPQVQVQDGGEFAAETVLFDDDLDLAVLRLDSSPAESLTLAPETLERGATGAVLGYPGGGDLRGDEAAVRREMLAIGRDIYGEDTVRRRIYELQTRVQPGNSGGPFVSTSGEVAGVVFAAATTNEGIGYALTSGEVMPRVRQGVASDGAVSTGDCLR